MDFDFSLVLVIGAFVTGVVWLIDKLAFEKARLARIAAVEKEKERLLQSNNREDEQVAAVALTAQQYGFNVKPEKFKHTHEIVEYVKKDPVLTDYAKSFFPVIFVVLILRSFLAEPFQIPSGSMLPTLEVGDFILVNKFAYGIRLPVIGTKIISIGEPERGDVMVFIQPQDGRHFIKRVIGLPGDHVRYDYTTKKLYINGQEMVQSYLGEEREQSSGYRVFAYQENLTGVEHRIYKAGDQSIVTPRGRPDMPLEGRVIPEGEYFMMGDNRDNSSDSRFWGTVPEENIVGKAVYIWMHYNKLLSLPSFKNNGAI